MKKWIALIVVGGVFAAVWFFMPGNSMAPPADQKPRPAPSIAASAAASLSGPMASPASATDLAVLTPIQARIAEITRCYLGEASCPVPENDSREGHFTLVEALERELSELLRLREKQGASHELDQYLKDQALFWLTESENRLRSAALRLLASLPPSAEGLQAVLTALPSTTGSGAIELSLHELKRYADSENAASITQTLQNYLTEGGALRASEKVAWGTGEFMTSANLESFKETARRLPPQSKARKALESAISEFELRQGGG